MADIKTRDAVKGTIKTIDKAAIASERMKSYTLLKGYFEGEVCKHTAFQSVFLLTKNSGRIALPP